jgi:hypothetical protein
MKWSKVAEIGATLGTATLIGLNILQHKREEEQKHEHKRTLLRPRHIVLGSSLVAAGLALWQMNRHHHHLAA